MLTAPEPIYLKDLLLTTKDGDWGKEEPRDGYVAYRVIRGADFPNVRRGDISTVPRCYLDARTVDRRTLEPHDIILETAGGNRDRPTGRSLLVTERLLGKFDSPVTCASFCRFMRVDSKKADPRYVFWLLQHLYQRGEMWEHQVQHTGVARFQYTRFAGSVPISLPPRTTQTAVADVLGALDERIELNCRTSRTLERLARAIFRAWFVDFEPVKAKAAGALSFPSVPQEAFDTLPNRLVESELGPIPEQRFFWAY